MIKTYVRKPEPIQAIQWTGDNLEEIRRFVDSLAMKNEKPRDCYTDRLRDGSIDLIIDTSTGWDERRVVCKQYGYVFMLAPGCICTRTRESFESAFEEI